MQINDLITKYQISLMPDGTLRCYGLTPDARATVAALKPQIVARIQEQRQAEDALRRKRAETFDAIPGVLELRKAREQMAAWNAAFRRMMDNGDGTMPKIDHPTNDQLAELEKKYPMAVFALEAQYRASVTENYQLSAIWSDAYHALQDGVDPTAVKAAHDQKMAEFVSSHLWD